MISKTAQVVLGLLLSGCTVNTYHTTIPEPKRRIDAPAPHDVQESTSKAEEKLVAKKPEPAVIGNRRIRPECGVYQPLPVPAPIKIDLKEVEAARTATEINEIALLNIKALNKQFASYSERQQKHYADYVKRCVVK